MIQLSDRLSYVMKRADETILAYIVSLHSRNKASYAIIGIVKPSDNCNCCMSD